jgi:hypothetical protein
MSQLKNFQRLNVSPLHTGCNLHRVTEALSNLLVFINTLFNNVHSLQLLRRFFFGTRLDISELIREV